MSNSYELIDLKSRGAARPVALPRRWLPWITSLALTIGVFWYLLSQIDYDVGQIARRISRPAPRPFLIFVALLLAGVAARALRFWALLGRAVSVKLLIGITLARNMFADLLPARLGGLSYVYFLTQRAHRPLEEGLASLFLAFLFDLVAIAPLLVVAFLVVGGGGQIPASWLFPAALVLGAAAYTVIRVAEPLVWRVSVRLRPGAARRRLALANRLTGAAVALATMRERGSFGLVFVLSIIVRICKFGSYYFLVQAVAPTVATLGIFRVFLGVASAELAAALPIHGIAGFGTWDAAWAFSFSQLGFSEREAIISGFSVHFLSQLVEYSMGAGALLWLMRPGPGQRPT